MLSRAWTSLVANLETLGTDCGLTDVYRSEDNIFSSPEENIETKYGVGNKKKNKMLLIKLNQIHKIILKGILPILGKFWAAQLSYGYAARYSTVCAYSTSSMSSQRVKSLLETRATSATSIHATSTPEAPEDSKERVRPEGSLSWLIRAWIVVQLSSSLQ